MKELSVEDEGEEEQFFTPRSEPDDDAQFFDALEEIKGVADGLGAQEVSREEAVHKIATQIYDYLETRKWRHKYLKRVVGGPKQSTTLEAALAATVGAHPIEQRIEGVRRTYLKAARTMLALVNPEGTTTASTQGLVASINGRIAYFQNLIRILAEVRGTHLGRTGKLRLKLAGDVKAYEGILEKLLQIRFAAVQLSTKTPRVPSEEEFYALCQQQGISVAAALGSELTTFIKQTHKVFTSYRKLAALGASTGTALSGHMRDLVKQAVKDYAKGLEQKKKEDLEREQSLLQRAQAELLSLDTAEKLFDIGIGVGRSYAGAFAPAFGAVGAGKAGFKRYLQGRSAQDAYEKFVNETRSKNQSLVEAMQADGMVMIGAGTIARMEANFDFVMGLMGFVPGSFIPGWGLISGAFKGVFQAFKQELEASLGAAEVASVGERLAEKIKSIAADDIVPGITAAAKKADGRLATGTGQDQLALEAGLLSPVVTAVIEQLATVIARVFPQNPAMWLSPEAIAGVVEEVCTVPAEALAAVSITVDAPGFSGIEEKKITRSDGSGTAFEGTRFGTGKRWTFTELGRGAPIDGGTRYSRALITYNADSARTIEFDGEVRIYHTGSTATHATMKLLRVLRGAETTDIWQGRTVYGAGYSVSGVQHPGTWHKVFGSTYVFIPADGQQGHIVDPTARAWPTPAIPGLGGSQPSLPSTPTSIADILEDPQNYQVPLAVFGIDTTHNPDEGTGKFELPE
ncbi:hypothetical protein [Streptomyces sp. NPDC048419]|uniref:hypothetical protein n=1 Tax=Streptomyces sp. NPDC048419 TaxID=3365547 RepID=UPI00371AF567